MGQVSTWYLCILQLVLQSYLKAGVPAALLGSGRSRVVLTWLWDVLVTPHTVVTTEREPGGWLAFCCQGTES